MKHPHRALSVLFLFFQFVFPVQAQDLAEETAARIDRYYQLVGPEVGCRLYDPCYVLTLAELRPAGRWNGNPFKDEAHKAKFEALDRVARTQGFSFRVSADGGLEVLSLNGLKRLSANSGFTWLEPFPDSGGWAEWEDWTLKSMAAAQAYAQQQGIEREDIGFHLVEGFMLGYPQAAVESYMFASSDPVHHARAIDVGMAHSMELENGAPDYSILPESCLDPTILKQADTWEQFLARFYALPEVRNRSTAAPFMAARRRLKGELHHSLNEIWWSGYELEHPWQLRRSAHTRHHERVLYRHQEELERMVLDRRPPQDWILACQRWMTEDGSPGHFSERVLDNWYWFGGWGFSPQRKRFSQAVDQVQPQLFLALAKKRLEQRQSQTGEPWSLNETQLLYRHPLFRKRFKDLSPEDQEFVRKDISEHLEDKTWYHFRGEVEAAGGLDAFLGGYQTSDG